MSAHVLLNFLNQLRKRDKMRGLLSILSLFRNEFIKFNNTGAQMLDSIYHMTLKLLKNHIFGVNSLRFSHLLRITVTVRSLHIITKSVNHQWFINFNTYGLISLTDTMSYDK